MEGLPLLPVHGGAGRPSSCHFQVKLASSDPLINYAVGHQTWCFLSQLVWILSASPAAEEEPGNVQPALHWMHLPLQRLQQTQAVQQALPEREVCFRWGLPAGACVCLFKTSWFNLERRFGSCWRDLSTVRSDSGSTASCWNTLQTPSASTSQTKSTRLS